MIAITDYQGRTAYGLGDVPASSLVVAVDADLSEFDTVSVEVLDPLGQALTGWNVSIADDTVVLDYNPDEVPPEFDDEGLPYGWHEDPDDPGTFIFTPYVPPTTGPGNDQGPFLIAGVYPVLLSLHSDTAHERLETLHLIAEDPADGWLGIDRTRALWADAPEDDFALYELLQAAKKAVVDFAPALGDGDPVPVSYRQAQMLQARAIWNSSRATNADQIGAGDYAVTVFPLDWNVKQLLRPKTVPVLG